MKPYEVTYFWARAAMLDQKVEDAKEKGTVFHPSDNFLEISDSPILANAVIQNEPKEIILKLRYPLTKENLPLERLDKIAQEFYHGKAFVMFYKGPTADRRFFEKAYSAPYIK